LAILYSLLFLDAGRLLWLDANSHGSHELLGQVLKRALKIKLINIDDLFTTDDLVLSILQKSKDKLIKGYLKELSPKKNFVYATKSEARFWGPNKPRVVDPFVNVRGKLIRVSELCPTLKKIFADFKTTYQFIGVK
jgi:hypothetical protein